VSYWKGRGVSQDFALAHMWFTLAAATGDKDAQEARDSLAKAMSAEQLQKAGELARQMCVDMPRACNR
jgi:Sel1 repeat.